MTKYVYTFGKGRADGTAELTELLGGKGAGLAEMARLGFPVPPGFTITTAVCQHFLEKDRHYPDGLESQVRDGIKHVERVIRTRFGDPKNPLLVSVRSGAARSMPGMMETILNLGLNDETVVGLIHRTDNPRFGYDSYRRFIQMYSHVVLGIDAEVFEGQLAALKSERGVKDDLDLAAADLERLVEEYREIVRRERGAHFPQDVEEQLWGAVGAVLQSWNTARAVEYRRIHQIASRGGTACTVQAMVFGNLGRRSATGVAFTRDPATGTKRFFGEYLMNAQGEDVVAGIRTPLPLADGAPGSTQPKETLAAALPECYHELEKLQQKLEHHYRDMQDLEFTIQEGELWLLQTRSGKRTAQAAVRIAVDMVSEGLIGKEEALLRIEPAQLDQMLHPTLDPTVRTAPIAVGLPASPGGAVGRIVFSADAAVAWYQNGERTVLVRPETSPDDIHGMHVAEGFLTARGGLTSHAAVVARGMGKPCVVGCETLHIDPETKEMRVGGQIYAEGNWLTIDGSTGAVIAGQMPLVTPQLVGEFETFMSWADALRSLKVRANADTPKDAEVAKAFGAEGIGLARTEHMFFDPERLPVVRECLLAEDRETRKRALTRLLPMQKADFKGLFKVMAGAPVTIRLLDMPLHEFLPTRVDEIAETARAMGWTADRVRERAEMLREVNPMLGHRGCRLGITHPEIYGMQVQAIIEAVCDLARETGMESRPEIEAPLIAHANELRHLRAIIERVAEEAISRAGQRVPYTIGTMIELPRAAITADQIARHADFFSFGTNDLTQTTFGISRDDAGTFLKAYGEKHLFPHDPFQCIDTDGVGVLMRWAVERARAAKPGMEIGICGEHGGEPNSIALCHRLGLDYVSCSPYRVPIARLAAAQAVLTTGERK